MVVLWNFYRISQGSSGIPIGFLLDFHEVSMESLSDFYGISVGFLWES